MKIDNEYSSANMDECKWLRERGIKYTFVKVDDKGVTWYKFKKTPRLFECLKNYYIDNKYME